MENGHISFKRQPKCDSNLVMLINRSPNHLTTTPLAAQGQHFKHYFIMLYYHSATNFTTKINILKSKLGPRYFSVGLITFEKRYYGKPLLPKALQLSGNQVEIHVDTIEL